MPPKKIVSDEILKDCREKRCGYKRDGVQNCYRWATHKPYGACESYCFRHAEKWVACEKPILWEKQKDEIKKSLDIDLEKL